MSGNLVIPRDIANKLAPKPGTCSSCRFLLVHSGDWECRRYPPAVNVIMAIRPPQVQPAPMPLCCYPIVSNEHWCGEWKAKGTDA